MSAVASVADGAGPGRREQRRIAVAAFALWAAISVLRSMVRLERVDCEALRARWRAGEPSVLAFWHGRAAMLPFFYEGAGATIMNSRHRDGEIVSRALERFGIASTRGSSSRGAVAGMLGLLRAFRAGRDLALIPDGPRGPAGIAKAGAVELARATGAPLFPLAVSCSFAVRLRSWDRLMLPLPCARVVLVAGEPFAFDEGGKDAREHRRAALETRLRDVTRRADLLAGRPPDAA